MKKYIIFAAVLMGTAAFTFALNYITGWNTTLHENLLIIVLVEMINMQVKAQES